MLISQKALREHENHAQSLTMAAMGRADNVLFLFFTVGCWLPHKFEK